MSTVNFTLTHPIHFAAGNFDGKLGDLCVWREPGQLIVYRGGELLTHFPMSKVSLQGLSLDKLLNVSLPQQSTPKEPVPKEPVPKEATPKAPEVKPETRVEVKPEPKVIPRKEFSKK